MLTLYIEHNHVNILSSLKDDWCDHDTGHFTTVCNPEYHELTPPWVGCHKSQDSQSIETNFVGKWKPVTRLKHNQGGKIHSVYIMS